MQLASGFLAVSLELSSAGLEAFVGSFGELPAAQLGSESGVVLTRGADLFLVASMDRPAAASDGVLRLVFEPVPHWLLLTKHSSEQSH